MPSPLYYFLLFLGSLLLGNSTSSYAQDEAAAQADSYLESKMAALEQYGRRSEDLQARLLKKLQKKEARLARKLAAKDSAAYVRYQKLPLDYDSIALLAKDTTAMLPRHTPSIRSIDSLKNIQRFISDQSGKLKLPGEAAAASGLTKDYTEELQQLQQQLQVQESLNTLIRQREQALSSILGEVDIAGFKSIQKDIYYAREKLNSWKELAAEPDEAELKALEYLQGLEGFDQYLSSSNRNAWGGLGNNATAADLQRMGFQTKVQVGDMLQQKLGSNLEAVQEQLSGQISDYTESLQDIKRKTDEVKQTLNEGKQSLEEAKAAFKNIKQTKRPAFKKNPERGKPFWQRLDYQYNFQSSRATPDGNRPAMADWGAAVAFRHTPKLSYGMGIAGTLGMGQNWQNIRFSYEGISLRVYADWIWQYGISVQAGYERSFRPANRAYLPTQVPTNDQLPNDNDNLFRTAFGGQQQAAYIGLMKRYRINSKWNGTFLAGYNLLWRQEGYRSPWMIRLGWEK